MGTPEFAVGTLKALVDNCYNVVAVVTQPDKPVGRHQDTLQPSAVKVYAQEHGIPVLQPVKMRDPEFIGHLRSYAADLQVVVAFRMLPEVVWAMPRFGTFNVHAALLPQYRGAAPINWAVINGETKTGVTTFFLDHDIDTGRIIMQKTFDIHDDYNVEDVYNGLMRLGSEIALETVNRIIEGNGHIASMPQERIIREGEVLHTAPKIFKDTCRIDWNRDAKGIYDFVRGLSPYPGAWTTLVSPEGKSVVLKIYKTLKTTVKAAAAPGSIIVDNSSLFIASTDNMLQIEELQAAGKRRMSARDFLNGQRGVELMKVE